jgi:transcription elongation factor Elf1
MKRQPIRLRLAMAFRCPMCGVGPQVPCDVQKPLHNAGYQLGIHKARLDRVTPRRLRLYHEGRF